MNYVLDYGICSLIFLLVVAFRYFTIRRFPTALNKFFDKIIYCAVADLFLDVIGSYTIDNAAIVPIWLNYAVNTLFYSIQVIFPILLASYVLYMTGTSYVKKPKYMWLLLPGVISILALIINPLTHSFFYVENINEANTYFRGELFNTLYIQSIFYFVLTVALLIRFKNIISKNQFYTIFAFVLINFTAMIVQYFYPSILLTGVGISVSVLLMFFNIENPESMTDQITGCFNFSALLLYLNSIIPENKRLWLVAVDIEGVRRINTTFGVWCGNETLSKIGDYLNHLLGKNAWVFRMIGTRFLIITNSRKNYLLAAESISTRFKTAWDTSSGKIKLVATIRHFGEKSKFNSTEEIINLIDLSFSSDDYNAIGTTQSIDLDLLSIGKRAAMVEEALENCLEQNKGFHLCFQPLYNVSKDGYTSAEVLLRLDSDNLGVISPGEFIPVAENRGLISTIDRLVIRKTCEFMKAYPELKELGIDTIKINLSAAEFFTDIYHDISSLISEYHCDPNMFCFEVTETAATTHREVLGKFMNKMITLGYSFALDDFGTGYANLNQINQLPFSIVKIDRSLLIAEGEKDQKMYHDLINMFNQMGLITVAEGVETPEQAERVKSTGSAFIQGYYYTVPLQEYEFIEFLKKHAK